MEVKRLQHRTRTRGVEASSAQQMEDALNTALEELENAGQGILSVQIFPAAPAAGAFTAFIVYTDNVGLDADFNLRHNERDREKNRKSDALDQRAAERRAQNEADAIRPGRDAGSTPGS
ncbi:MAG: hypothetical protein M3Z20_08870 [Chloroflexota bacterium]|nr:hypothetical protein [Chloroflexota bacterium]